MNENIAYAIAAIIVLTAFVLLGWWALTWSTHTLVWLSFMGLSLGSASSLKR